MKVFSQCMSCMMQQIQTAMRLLKPNIKEYEIVEAQRKLMEYISKQDLKSVNNVLLGAKTYEIIANALNMEDPYKEQKKIYNDRALALYDKVVEWISQHEQNNGQILVDDKDSKQPSSKNIKLRNQLIIAIKASIIGNSIDFGTNSSINIEDEIEEIMHTELKGNVEIDEFINDLINSNKILIIGDNTGEIVFDKLFIEKLKLIFPQKQYVYAVRSGPIINDATIEDAEYIGMTKVCKVVQSSQTPGFIMELSSKEFKEEFESSDLLISKGQGNFESIIDENTSDKPVYFLLKAKCKLISEIFRVPLGSLLLARKTKELINRIESQEL
ncbi:MAG: damage-control phosphatase ARMT1 family protein [Promethearchaeota archaeon]